jgi:hypothetical protein
MHFLGSLYMDNLPIYDLSPLEGLKLYDLQMNKTLVTNLAPLRGMPLISVGLRETPVTDLTPLLGARVEQLEIGLTKVMNLALLKYFPLRRLVMDGDGLRLAPISRPLITHAGKTKVTSITALKGCQ